MALDGSVGDRFTSGRLPRRLRPLTASQAVELLPDLVYALRYSKAELSTAGVAEGPAIVRLNLRSDRSRRWTLLRTDFDKLKSVAQKFSIFYVTEPVQSWRNRIQALLLDEFSQ